MLGLLGVLVFAATLPMTRLATGPVGAPQLEGVFIAAGRAVVAAVLSLIWLLVARAAWPRRRQWVDLGFVSLGVVFGFPFFTSLALRHVESIHASVMVGVLPLATAVVGALLNRQRPSKRFWLCALGGAALVVSYALMRNRAGPGWSLHGADALLLLAMLAAAVGYSWGARLAAQMPAEQVICWALLLSLPLTLPLAWASRPEHPQEIAASAWAGFAYTGVFSMWLGFFAWYRGLALGGTVRVSQVQLLQPFIGMLFAVPLLGERIDALSGGFALAVLATVLIGRRSAISNSASAGSHSAPDAFKRPSS